MYTCFFLFDRKFIYKLFDKGKKILDFVVKVRVVIVEYEEFRGKSKLFYFVSVDRKLR